VTVIGSSIVAKAYLTRQKVMNALILIDFQVGFADPVWGDRNKPQAEENTQNLLDRWRDETQPIIHVKHVSTEPGSPLSGAGTEFKAEVVPLEGETVVEKTVNSAFIGTRLDALLKSIGARDLTVCGLTTPHCVSSTTRMAANLGYNVRLVADACAAFTSNADIGFDSGVPFTADEIHRSALAHLHGEFAHVCQCSEALKEM